MAELTNLESKLGEVLGLAMAAQGATDKVKKLDDLDDDLAKTLERMNEEAKEAEERAPWPRPARSDTGRSSRRSTSVRATPVCRSSSNGVSRSSSDISSR